MKYREIITLLEADGWQHFRPTGSQLHYNHATKPGAVTVAGGG